MIGWIMRWLPSGSFAWLTLHELRLARASAGKMGWTRWIGLVLILLWIAAGIWLGQLLADIPIGAGPIRMAAAALGSILIFTFMTTQAIVGSQRTLYGAGDLDLLFTAPIPPRTVMRAKLIGIAATVVLSFALIILPIALPIAWYGHPQLFGIPALILALALTAACLGLGITLLLTRIAGPRAARTMGQMVAALTAGALFLTSQFMAHGDDAQRGAVMLVFDRMMATGFAQHGFGALPGMAAFGDPGAVTALLAGSILLFILTTRAMQHWFLSGYLAGGMKLSRPRRARRSVAKLFHAGLFRTIYAKEWRLMARDPALGFQMLLRLVYLAPLLFLALRPGQNFPIAPSLAFSSVLIAGQLVSSLVWLAVSAEDSPDLIAVAPVAKHEIDRAKLTAALMMAAPLGLILPIGIGLTHIPAAIVALAFTGLAGWLTGLVEVTFAKPAPRASFRKRQGGGSFVRSIAQFAVSMLVGGVAAGLVWAMTEPWTF